jgi:hypothetical protein
MLLPDVLVPEIGVHCPAELVNLLVDVVMQDGSLLIDQCHTVNLQRS